jgi:hypothetical protein
MSSLHADSHALIPMGVAGAEPEHFRCRIYGDAPEPREAEAARVAFLELLAGEGALDCPAYDGWVAALQARGWLDDAPALEPDPDGPGRVGRWCLNEHGRAAWAALREGA